MTRRSAPGGAAAPLLHWLVVVGGLAILATSRIVEADAIVPTCMGALFGTASGQLLAWLRLRAWAALCITTTLLVVGALCWWNASVMPGAMVEAYVPAAACGYLSWTARGALAAFWFPAVPWSLAIIEADSSEATVVGPGWALWTVLGGLLIATLWSRESRRVAQWKTHALGDLAEPARRVVLREAPLRAEARGAWGVALGAATILLAACIAPQLRQGEDGVVNAAVVEQRREPDVQPTSVAATRAPGAWVTCCPEAAPVKTRRVREYISPRRQSVEAHRAAPISCVACVGGLPAGSATSGSVLAGVSSEIGRSTSSPYAPLVRAAPLTHATNSAEDEASRAPATDPAARRHAPLAAPTGSRRETVQPPSAQAEWDYVEASPSGLPLLRGLLALILAGGLANLVLRPLRRWFILRHLRRPWWHESVSQRVSNLWQLALIGLRDAGWHHGSGEPPLELARRVAIEPMEICAGVLARARHGVRVDAADLAAMEHAAEAAFTAARLRAGWLARVASWWRTPLG